MFTVSAIGGHQRILEQSIDVRGVGPNILDESLAKDSKFAF